MVSLMQIGTVFASERYICPNAVGVDIGQQYLLLTGPLHKCLSVTLSAL